MPSVSIFRSGSTKDVELDAPALQPHLLAQGEAKWSDFWVCSSSAQIKCGVIPDPMQLLIWNTWESEPIGEITFANTFKMKISHGTLAGSDGKLPCPAKLLVKFQGSELKWSTGKKVAHILQSAQTGLSESVSSTESCTSSCDPFTWESLGMEERCKFPLRQETMLQKCKSSVAWLIYSVYE